MVKTLQETVELMNSSDYKDRFKAEYYQLEYRYLRLKQMLDDWGNDRLTFTPTCDKEIYMQQINAMSEYINILQKRASVENVEL